MEISFSKNYEKIILFPIGAGLLTAIQSHAIVGLTIKPQGQNVVLSWPSTSAATYIVQYRDAFDSSHQWQTLATVPGLDGTTTYSDPMTFPTGGSQSSQTMATTTGITTLSTTDTDTTTDSGTNSRPMPPLPPGLILNDDGSVTVAPVGSLSTMIAAAASGALLPGTPPQGGGMASTPTYRFYRVVISGVQLYGITDGMVLSDYVSLPVELGNASGSISSISLLCDGVTVPNAVLFPPFSYPLVFTMDTLMLSNGPHQITASAQWSDTSGVVGEAESAPISVVIANEVSFENWMPLYGELGDSLLIRATSAHVDTDWWIDVYVIRGGYDVPIGTLQGHTDNGDIAVAWDLIGPYGESYSSDDDFVFEVSTEYTDPPAPPTYRVKDPWPGKGAWAAACQHAWDNSLDTEVMYGELSGFVGQAKQMNCAVMPPPTSENYPYGLDFDPNNIQGDSDWANFKLALFNPSTRNLIYFGHGTQGGLGNDSSNASRSISVSEISTNLHTLPRGQTNRHGFRFVFIDACATSEGSMPEAFGIIHRENVPGGDYVDASLRPSAYVGWPKDKMIGLMDGKYPNYNHINYMLHLQNEMILNGRGIKDAAIRAVHYPDVVGIGEQSSKVYGYWDLTIGAYNQ